MSITSTRSKIGIEPLDVDLVFSGRTLSETEHQELDAFFLAKHAAKRIKNGQQPAVVAVRKRAIRKS